MIQSTTSARVATHLDILPREAHVVPLQQQRPERQSLGRAPVDALALLDRLRACVTCVYGAYMCVRAWSDCVWSLCMDVSSRRGYVVEALLTFLRAPRIFSSCLWSTKPSGTVQIFSPMSLKRSTWMPVSRMRLNWWVFVQLGGVPQVNFT